MKILKMRFASLPILVLMYRYEIFSTTVGDIENHVPIIEAIK